MKRVAVLASGEGTNAEALIRGLAASEAGRVVLVASNRREAGALVRAQRLGVETLTFTREELSAPDGLVRSLGERRIDLVVLAGFLWLVPQPLLAAFPGRILNIHPALLPRHGGQGLYGARVHRAVLASGDRQSGITIHRIDAEYDRGQIVAQYTCPVEPDDTPQSLARRIHDLEHRYYPQEVERLLGTL